MKTVDGVDFAKASNFDIESGEPVIYFSIINEERHDELRNKISLALLVVIKDEAEKISIIMGGEDCLLLMSFIDVMIKIIEFQNEIEMEAMDNFLAKFNSSLLIKMLMLVDKYRSIEKERFVKTLKISIIAALRK
jgi:hypothetical protein